MTIDRRSLVLAGTAGAALGGLVRSAEAGAQTAPPVAARAMSPGLVEPVETIDLWPAGAPGAPAMALTETVNERSTDPQLTDRAVLGISRPRMVDVSEVTNACGIPICDEKAVDSSTIEADDIMTQVL